MHEFLADYFWYGVVILAIAYGLLIIAMRMSSAASEYDDDLEADYRTLIKKHLP